MHCLLNSTKTKSLPKAALRLWQQLLSFFTLLVRGFALRRKPRHSTPPLLVSHAAQALPKLKVGRSSMQTGIRLIATNKRGCNDSSVDRTDSTDTETDHTPHNRYSMPKMTAAPQEVRSALGSSSALFERNTDTNSLYTLADRTPKTFTTFNLNRMQSILRLLGTTVAVVLLSFVSYTSKAQYLQNVGPVTVTTDKPDYAPRSNAVFTGTGFLPGEIVTLKVKNLFRACSTVTADSSYVPWTVVVDGSGAFITNWTVCDCAGDSLRLRAVGQTSHDTAYVYFSDAANDLFSYASNCTTSKTTFCLTETVCVKATGTSGNNYIEWYNPSNVLTNRTPSTGDQTGDISSSFAPTSAGTWTIKLVKKGGTIQNTITITVNAAPSITATNIGNVNSPSGSCGASVTMGSNVTVNSGTPAPTITYSLTNFGTTIANPYTFPVGTTTVYVKASNSCGNDIKAFTVTVKDVTAPVITTNGDKNVKADAGQCGAAVTVSASATDNCSVGTPTGVRSDALALNAPYPVGTTTIKWNVTDANGNAATEVTQTVVVTDDQKPVITTNGDKNVKADAGQCGAAVTVSASATDNCSVGTPTGVRSDALALNAPYPVGTTTIKWNVTDANGNAATEVTQTVVVTDDQKPVITTNGDKNVKADAGQCGAAVTVSASATDNCSVGTPTGVRSDALALNAPYPVGTTTIKWNVTDANGNAATEVTQTVVVTDDQKPVITTNGDKNVKADAGQCGAAVTVSASATDNCSVGTPTGVRSDALALNAPYPVGTTTIKWNVTDANGNAATEVTQTVVVTDDQKPVITTNGDKNVKADAGQCGAAVTVSASATDNCSVGTPTGVRSDALALNAPYPVGTTTIKWNVTDANGNAATEVTQTVVVTDDQKPVITTNGDKNVKADAGQCGAAVTVSASATDNCSVGTPTGVRSDALALNAPYPVGTTTIKWNVTDANGNAATEVTQTVVVTDDQKPVITTNGDKNVKADAGQCGAAVTVSASATDNCSVGTPTGVRSDALALNAPYPVGTTTIKWNVTDANGNAATEVTQTVVVTDDQKPVITTNGDKNVKADAGQCGAAVTVSASATDNCSVGTPTGVRSDALALNAPYPVGTTTIKWNVTDANGNAATEVTQTVVVTDDQKPVITTNGDKNVKADAGQCGAAVTVSASATDNCSVGTPTGVRSDALALNAPYPVGTTTIKWNVTDANGNAATEVTQTVVVTDDQKPVITTNGDKNVKADAGQCGAAVTVSASATDNCSVGTPTGVRSDALALNAPYPVGTTTIKWNVTDANGNAATEVTQTVVVTDDQKPVITTNGDKNVKADAGQCGAAVTVSASATDNCSVGTPTGVRSDALALNAPYPVGTTTIKWNVTDANGNAATEVTQTVVVTDDQKPVITTNGDKNVKADAGQCGAAVTVSASATDNCSVGTPTGVRSDALALNAPYPVGTTTIKWNVTDANGNAATEVTQTVVVTDDQKPVITTNGDKNVKADAGQCGAAVTVSASATDNCSVGTPTGVRSDALALNAPYPVGTTTIKWNVTDANGNAATEVTQTVVVTDDQKPVITTNGDKNVKADAGQCGAAVTVSASATDNCSVGTPTGVRSDALALNAPYPVGTTTIKWNVTDANGNAATEVTQTVVVTDDQKPVITTNGDKNVKADAGQCGAAVTVSASATDNCSVGTPTGVRSDALALNAPYPVGTTTIKWNVTDANGNAATEVTQTVVVTDDQKPVITTNGDKNVKADAGQCGAAVTVSASATDNCSVGTPTGVRSDALALNAPYPVGTTTIKWNVTDANGNAATEVTQTVVVTDDQKPTIVAPPAVSAFTNTACTATGVSLGTPNVGDNCGVKSVINDAPTAFPLGQTTVTWTVTDNSNNTATATQVVTVADNVKPVFSTFPTDIKLKECQDVATWSEPTVTDNCTSNIVPSRTGSSSGSTFAKGTSTIISYTAKDASGNTCTKSFTVTRPAALAANGSNSNPILYFGYTGDQTTTISVTPGGGNGPYTISFTMNRPLKCNYINDAGDEVWASSGSNLNNSCPSSGSPILAPQTTFANATTGSVTLTLLADAVITVTVTDKDGCSTNYSTTVYAEDVRCFAGNSTLHKYTVCHKTGNTKNPCVTICVDQDAVNEHLAHGDYLGTCNKTCTAPTTTTTTTTTSNRIAELPVEEVNANKLSVTAIPNPAISQFTIKLTSNNIKDAITLKVYNQLGQVVDLKRNLFSGQTIQVGAAYTQGTYFVEVTQGKQREHLQVVKSN